MTDWLDGKLFPTQYPARFETFWKVYPCKHGKAEALKAFNGSKGKIGAKQKVGLDDLLAAVDRYKSYLAKNPSRQPMNASTYLNQERWTDEYEQPTPANDHTWKALRGTHVSKYQ